jgi:hypothetical protein
MLVVLIRLSQSCQLSLMFFNSIASKNDFTLCFFFNVLNSVKYIAFLP